MNVPTSYHVVITLFIVSFLPGFFTRCIPMKNCYPPHCRCKDRLPPTNEPINNIPQIVLFTFDDAVRTQDLQWYKTLFSPKRKNPNGCPICMTLFLQDKYTNYRAVRELHLYGMEIAVHSVSHRLPSSFWQKISRQDFEDEACKQKQNIHEKAGVPLENIRGWRSPFLQPSGETQYSVLQSCNFTYDSTLTVSKRRLSADTLWPFTLDYGWPLPCGVPPCPTSSYPGFWILPVVSLITSHETPAVYVDAFRPNSVKESYEFLWSNFQSYYTRKRPPFMLNMHSAWFSFPHNLKAMDEFIKKLITLPDVYIITSQQALDWLEKPVSLSRLDELPSWGCPHLNPIPRVTTPTVTTIKSSSNQTFPTTTDILPFSDKIVSTATALPSTTATVPITSVVTTDSLPTVPTSPDLESWTLSTTKREPIQTVTFKIPLYTDELYTTSLKPVVTSRRSTATVKVPLFIPTTGIPLKLPISTPSHLLITPKKTVPSTTPLRPTEHSTSVSQPSGSPQFTVTSTRLPHTTIKTTSEGLTTKSSYDSFTLTSVTLPNTTLGPASVPNITLDASLTIVHRTTSQITSHSSLQTTTSPVPVRITDELTPSRLRITTTTPGSSTVVNKVISTSSPVKQTTTPFPTKISTDATSLTTDFTISEVSNELRPEQSTHTPIRLASPEQTTHTPILLTTSEQTTSTSIRLTSPEQTTNIPIRLTSPEQTTNTPIRLTSQEQTTNTPIRLTSPEQTTHTPIMLTSSEQTTSTPIWLTSPEQTTNTTIRLASPEQTTSTPNLLTSPEQTTSTPILLTKIINHEEDNPTRVETSGQDRQVLFLYVPISVLSSVIVRLLWRLPC